LFVIYTIALVIPILDKGALAFLQTYPDVVIGIVGGAFAASLAFGYIIYTFYDTFFYGPDAMSLKKRPLLRYFAKHIDDWDTFSEARQKMFIEMTHITGKNLEESENFYSIGRGFRSHYNARIVCSIFVPAFTALFLAVFGYFSVNRFSSITAPYVFLEIPVILGIFFVSAALYIGAERPLNEAAQLEYLFVRRKIETDSSFVDTCCVAGINWKPIVKDEETYDFKKK